MPRQLEDFTGQQFGHVVVQEILPERSAAGARRCRVRCVHPDGQGKGCGRVFTTDLSSVRLGRSTTCGQHRAHPPRPLPDYTGRRFGNVIVESILSDRSAEGRRRCRCRCVHPTKDGPCGREFDTLLKSVTCGATKSCGHHRPGRFTRKTIKAFPKSRKHGEKWYLLPAKAAVVLGVSRREMTRLMAYDRYLDRGMDTNTFFIERAGHVETVDYVSLDDLNESKRLRKLSKPVEEIAGYVHLPTFAKKVGVSVVRIREVARGFNLGRGFTVSDLPHG
jgi:hypothetical protein